MNNMNIQTNPNDNENHYKRIGSQRKTKSTTDFVTINHVPLKGRNSLGIKIISITALLLYLIFVILIAVLTQQYTLFLLLFVLINVIIVWLFGRMFTRMMLFPNSNMLIAYFMNRSLYKKVTQELCKLLKYIVNVLEHMKDGREFDSEKEHEKYVQDLVKGIEMLNLLLEANIYYSKVKNNRVSRFFNSLTEKMISVRKALKKVRVYHKGDKGVPITSSFYTFDFSIPIFESTGASSNRGKPAIILPEFEDSKENFENINNAKEETLELINMCMTQIVKKKCCLPSASGWGSPAFCYFEQLEYILSYNYNAVKFEAPSLHDSHKVPLMFFPAHGKHLCIDRSIIDKYGKNVTVSFDPNDSDSINCTCTTNNRPTVILCNPNALCYEQMVNYPHNFWLKYFMNHGSNVVAWNYRGYGCSKGSPDPYNIKRDGEAVIKFITDTLKLKGKICIYGRSLGGIVACHLGRNVKGVDLLIADRTLSNFETLTKKKMYGKFIHYAFDFFSCGWEVNNDTNFLESNVSCKILTCDPSDDVIDLSSSLYTGVALRLIEREKKLTKRIEVEKYKMFLNNDTAFFNAMKEFFEIYNLMAYSLKEEDKLIYEQKQGLLESNPKEEIKKEPISTDKTSIERSKHAKEITKNLMNVRYASSRETMQEKYGVREVDYRDSIHQIFNSYIKPFRNTFASLNAGVLTLYEIFHKDHIGVLEDLKLFIIFLEIYGTGRAIKPEGEYVSIIQRRRNSIKKIDLIVTELIALSKTEADPGSKHKNLGAEIQQLSTIIIEGFKTIKSYLEERVGEHSFDENDKKRNHLRNRINYDSGEESEADPEKCFKYPLERHLGYVMPIRCGHRGYPKDKDKEKKAFDIFLIVNEFTSPSRCDTEDINNHSDSD